MFATNLRENSNGKRKHLRLVAILLLTAVAVFFTMGETALAKKKKKNKRNQFCTQTATMAFKACQNEIADDYYIDYANCINVEKDEDRAECYLDAKADFKEAKEECKDQFEARRDLCEDLGQGRYDPEIDPDDFVDPATITAGNANPYFPLVPGYKWTYKGYEDEDRDEVIETIVVEVLDGESITIAGVECVVVRDIVYEGDSEDEENIIEDTYDWYGQQDDGTVWYMGEFSLSKEECDEDDEGESPCEGLYSEDGSWKHGYEGGKAGILMFGDLTAVDVGTVYRQEVSYGNAEDAAELLSKDAGPVTVTAGTYTDVVQTLDFTPIEPDATEYKYYAWGIGMIKEEALEDGELTEEFVELMSFTP